MGRLPLPRLGSPQHAVFSRGRAPLPRHCCAFTKVACSTWAAGGMGSRSTSVGQEEPCGGSALSHCRVGCQHGSSGMTLMRASTPGDTPLESLMTQPGSCTGKHMCRPAYLGRPQQGYEHHSSQQRTHKGQRARRAAHPRLPRLLPPAPALQLGALVGLAQWQQQFSVAVTQWNVGASPASLASQFASPCTY